MEELFGCPIAVGTIDAVLTRTAETLETVYDELLEFAGVVGSDRFSAYNSLEPERRQVCWSHLRRDYTFYADLGLGAQGGVRARRA